MTNRTHTRYPLLSKRIIAIVGGFGSGKTEVAVNLARHHATTEKSLVPIVDLDLVNPYFRTRQAVNEMENIGIRVVTPRGGQFYADLPILLPEVKGAVESREGRLIIDVGGDAQGTRALGSLSGAFVAGEYDLLMVLNSRRPLTSDCARSIKTMARVEAAARLKFTGLIANSHMIDETDLDVLMEGYRLAREVGEEAGLPLTFISVTMDMLDRIDTGVIDCPVLPLSRSMLKPWERKKDAGSNHSGNERT